MNVIESEGTVVVLRMMSMSSRSSGTTSSIRRGMVGTTGGGLMSAAFLALNRNLMITGSHSVRTPAYRTLNVTDMQTWMMDGNI